MTGLACGRKGNAGNGRLRGWLSTWRSCCLSGRLAVCLAVGGVARLPPVAADVLGSLCCLSAVPRCCLSPLPVCWAPSCSCRSCLELSVSRLWADGLCSCGVCCCAVWAPAVCSALAWPRCLCSVGRSVLAGGRWLARRSRLALALAAAWVLGSVLLSPLPSVSRFSSAGLLSWAAAVSRGCACCLAWPRCRMPLAVGGRRWRCVGSARSRCAGLALPGWLVVSAGLLAGRLRLRLFPGLAGWLAACGS